MRRRRSRSIPGALGLAWGGILLGLAAVPAKSQQPTDGGQEAALLRQAMALEATGQLAQAAAVLHGLVIRPGSVRPLFELERVLRDRGILPQLLPSLDRRLQIDPRDPNAWALKLRVLFELDSLETIDIEARRWIRGDPLSLEPYRGTARLFEKVYGPARGLVVLREARSILEDPAALSVETGAILLEMGRTDEAVEEWGRVIGPDSLDPTADPEALAAAFVEALSEIPADPDDRRAGVLVALDAGLFDAAWDIVERVLGDLDPGPSGSFLTDVAREAERAESPKTTLLAYERLRELATDDRERRSLDLRISRAALAANDPEAFRIAEARLLDGVPPGSVERRVLSAALIDIVVGRRPPDDVARRLAAFREAFPGAPELDELAARTAAALHERGDEEAARRALEGVDGPHASLERAFLMLGQEDFQGAREALGLALPVLPPPTATATIQLMSLLDRLGTAGRALAAESAVLAHRGRTPAAIQAIRAGLPDLPGSERAALLAQAARLADGAGLPDEAADLRDDLIRTHPEAPEVGEATLALARHRWDREGDAEAAIRLLEALILARPEMPVIPDARRALERLRREASEAR